MLLAVVAVAAALRVPLLAGGMIDYDEGVYWQSLRAMAAGHPLFSSVYSSQPPAFLLLLLPGHLALGGGIAADRLTVLVLFLAGVAAAGRTAWLLGGPGAGLLAAALLAADPLGFRQSVALQADGPSMALALVGLAVAAEARARAGSPPLAAVAGAVLAIAVLTKLLALAAIPAALLLLLPSRKLPPPVGGGSGWGPAAPVAAATLGGIAATAALLLPFANVWPALWDQTVRLHLASRSLPAGGLDAPTLLRGIPIAIVAAAGVVVGVRRAPMLVAAGLAWLAAGAVLLALQHPLWPHHAVVLIPPLALLGGALAPRWRASTRVLAAGLLLGASLASALFVRSLQEPAAAVAPAVAALRADTVPGDVVITDDQYAAALAGRDTPPELVDTSFVRVDSGELTLATVQAVAERSRTRAVLLWTGRLARQPGLQAWLDQAFPRRVDLGDGRILYISETIA